MKISKEMRECMLQYIEQLKVEYDELSTDPFSNKARIAIRNEIESTKCILEEDRMIQTWDNLAAVFNLSDERPDRHKEELEALQRISDSEPSSFKQRMSAAEFSLD